MLSLGAPLAEIGAIPRSVSWACPARWHTGEPAVGCWYTMASSWWEAALTGSLRQLLWCKTFFVWLISSYQNEATAPECEAGRDVHTGLLPSGRAKQQGCPRPWQVQHHFLVPGPFFLFIRLPSINSCPLVSWSSLPFQEGPRCST